MGKYLSRAALAAIGNLSDNPRRIITRGVLDMATLTFDRSQEESYIYTGPMALADREGDNEAVKAAVEKALAKHFDKVKETLVEYEKQLKDTGRNSDTIKDEIAKLNTDGSKLIADQKKVNEELNARVLTAEQKLATALQSLEEQGGKKSGKSLGAQFVESPEFKAFAPNGRVPSKGSSSPFQTKTITSLPGSAGPAIHPQYLPNVLMPNFMPLTVRDLIGVGTTDSPSIIWVQENVFTNNAGYQGSEGSLKPQSDISYTQQTINVVTLAHWIKASKQVLADFGQLRTLIDQRLTFGLKLVEEREILFGDGHTNHLHGLVPQATPYNTGLTKANDTMLDIIRHAMLQVTLAFYPPTGICLSPTDWHNIELLKDTQHRYLMSNPNGVLPAMVWGLPVAQCFSFGAGEFLVGALKLAVTLFDREEANILVSTEDQDNFVRNLVTVLAEERLALGVSRPAAIINGAFPSGSTSD